MVQDVLAAGVKQQGIQCGLRCRTKDVASFLKKALRKGGEDPWEEIRDKAGVRAVVVYDEQVGRVREVIRTCFDVRQEEDKREWLTPETLGYLGVHFQVVLLDRDVEDKPDVKDLECEVQLHTRAQNLWATVSHELLYKAVSDPPGTVKRSIHRLMALLELFDEEVERCRDVALKQPGMEGAKMLAELERHFLRLTARGYDQQLSRQVIDVLRPLFTEGELATYRDRLDAFVASRQEKLQQLYEDYRDDDRNPLMSQPESLLVFERLDSDKFNLVEAWAGRLPNTLLESLAAIWGVSVDLS